MCLRFQNLKTRDLVALRLLEESSKSNQPNMKSILNSARKLLSDKLAGMSRQSGIGIICLNVKSINALGDSWRKVLLALFSA